MVNSRMNSLARATLDQRIASFRDIPDTATPSGGWIRAIRQALEMNAAQLARRIGVTRQTLDQFERHEVDGTIRLDSLRRAAEALNCRLVYAFVPNDTLEEMVMAQARRKVVDRLDVVDQTMLLENQRLPESAREEHLEFTARSIIGTRFLWSEPQAK